MENSPKPPSLQSFIAAYIGSVEQLEILCLLSRSPDKWWSPKDVFHVVQSSEHSVTACLEKYVQQTLLVADKGLYRYAPRRLELDKAVHELSQAYSERRVAVIEMIYKRPNDTIQDFADAFRFRKEK